MINLKQVGCASTAMLAMMLTATGVQADQTTPTILDGDSPVIEGKALTNVPYEIVRVADLNLYHPEGMKTLRGRIRAAVDRVCPDADFRDLRGTRAAQQCRSTSFASAMAQVDAALARADVGPSEILVAAR